MEEKLWYFEGFETKPGAVLERLCESDLKREAEALQAHVNH
jgi:hypothetical protein